MATSKTIRIHQLAKKLGVDSKVIIAKCEAEGVPGITGHMSPVKVGLAATIEEWFSAEASHSAIETAAKVDLEKVRKPRKRAKAKTAGDADGQTGSESESTTATLDAPADTVAADQRDTSAGSEDLPAQASEAAATSTPDAEVTPPAPPADAATSEPPAAKVAPETPTQIKAPADVVRAMGVQNVPSRPDVVKPAGQQLDTPTKAKLSGPKVIRVEKPEPDRAPRARRGPGGPTGTGGGNDVPGISRSRGPARGGGVRGTSGGPDDSGNRGGGGPGGGGQGGGPGGNKRRSLNSRRGRSADALLTGPTQLSKADADELDARLKGSTGYMKQRRRDLRSKGSAPGFMTQSAVQTGGKVEVEEPITIKGLSAATGIKTAQIVKFLFKQGVMANVNSSIGTESAMEIALEYDIELEVKALETAEQRVEKQFAARERIDVQSRPPVVTVLGHVDHGKTSLLDRIRKADVAAHEAGGITQHVGAYRVSVDGSDGKQKTVVFLDTPGHAAFTNMRARGAKMTDLVVLVCAADDGVMPQTIESINHAKAAGVPIIVALNKIDTPQATEENIRKIYGQLAEHGLNPVEWGGETEVIKTSALKGTGVTDLLEVLDYRAELLDLTADYGGAARGTVIEAEMQPGRGSVARVLVQDGQIKVGDFIVIGRAYGRVRDMTNDRDQQVQSAGPATPLEISGIDFVPDAGDKFFVTDSLKRAEEVAKQYRETERQQTLASKTKVTLDNFADAVAAGNIKDLRVVLKADVQGSIETLKQSLEEMGNSEVTVKVLHAAVGGITESDVLLADASDAIILGFHVTATPAVREIADRRKVDIRTYRVIYDLTDDVKKGLEGMLIPDKREEEIGQAEVREVFRITKVGNIAGCLVTEGSARKDAKIRVDRDGVVITDNRNIASLRRVKDEVREVRAGTECGVHLEGFDDLKVGDTLIFYKVTEVKRTLN